VRNTQEAPDPPSCPDRAASKLHTYNHAALVSSLESPVAHLLACGAVKAQRKLELINYTSCISNQQKAPSAAILGARQRSGKLVCSQGHGTVAAVAAVGAQDRAWRWAQEAQSKPQLPDLLKIHNLVRPELPAARGHEHSQLLTTFGQLSLCSWIRLSC
jgi:hypothetical protein